MRKQTPTNRHKRGLRQNHHLPSCPSITWGPRTVGFRPPYGFLRGFVDLFFEKRWSILVGRTGNRVASANTLENYHASGACYDGDGGSPLSRWAYIYGAFINRHLQHTVHGYTCNERFGLVIFCSRDDKRLLL